MTDSPLLAVAAYLAVVAAFGGTLALAQRAARRADERQAPTLGMPRAPARRIQRQLDELWRRIATTAIGLAPLPLLAAPLAAWLAPPERAGALAAAVAVLVLGLGGWRLWALYARVRIARLGMQVELSVAQHLGQLAREGFTVLHDVPVDARRRLGHVVVGQGRICAVDARYVPRELRDGKRLARVIVEHGALVFPGRRDLGLLAEVRRKAEALSARLVETLGESVEVRPVLLLPGWHVERRSPSDVEVVNGLFALDHFRNPRGARLDEALVARAALSLEDFARGRVASLPPLAAATESAGSPG